MHPPPPAVRSTPDTVIEQQQTVWDGRFALQVVRFRHRRFDGTMSEARTWEMLRRGHAAALLPYDPVTDQVVLIEQFRLPALAAGMDPVLVELPAGMCDPGEAPQDTARREAGEEAGLHPDRLHPIGTFLLTPGGCDETVAIFAGRVAAPASGADGVAGSGGLAAEAEDIRILVRPAAAAIADALDGRITNIITATALLWLAARRDWLRGAWTA
jgi:ADP-ribose pyrophosphatase